MQSEYHAKDIMQWSSCKNDAEFMQELCEGVHARVMQSSCEMMAGVQHAAQGCGGFNRYAHSAVPNLDDWMFGGLQVWRIASNDRIMI